MLQKGNRKLTRRVMLKLFGLGGTAAILASCQPKVVEVEKVVTQVVEVEKVVKETQVVEVEKIVKETVVVEATRPPKPAEEQITVHYLGGFGQSWEDFYNDEVLPRFYDLHPNVKVELTLIGSWMDLYNKIVTAAAGGMPPEVTRQKDFFTPDFAIRGVQAELDDYVATAPHITEDQYVPHSWKNMHWGGKIVATPLLIFSHHQHMNVELFEKAGLVDTDGVPIAPDTWEEVRETTNKLSDPDNLVYGHFIRDEAGKEDTVNYFHLWLAQAGGRFTDDDFSKFLFNSEEGLDALTFQVQLIKDGACKPPGISIPEIVPGGHVAWWHHASAYWEGFLRSNPDFRWRTAINPKRKTRGAILRGDHMALFAESPQRDAGWDFMSFHQTRDITLAYGKRWTMIMPRYDVMSDSFYTEPYKGVKGAMFTTEMAQFKEPGQQLQPIFPGYQESSYKIGAQLMLAYMLEISPEEALEQAERDGNAVLEAARRLLGVG